MSGEQSTRLEPSRHVAGKSHGRAKAVTACARMMLSNAGAHDIPHRRNLDYRSMYHGRVRWAVPWRVIADNPQQLVLPGVQGLSLGRDATGRYMDRWVSDDSPRPMVWDEHHVLAVTRPRRAHSLWLMWTRSWEFKCWYVQLQSPVVRKSRAIETMDHALDLVI